MTISRRQILQGAGGTAALATLSATQTVLGGSSASATPFDHHGKVRLPRRPTSVHDERGWKAVAKSFKVNRKVINLNAGWYHATPEYVTQAYRENLEKLNYSHTGFLNSKYGAYVAESRSRLAALCGVEVSELALTRGVTEALQKLILGYKKLGPGDVAMYSDIDYGAMQMTMAQLPDRRGAEVVRIRIPGQAFPGVPTAEAIIEAYTMALDKNPRTKLLLLTHVENRMGVVIPVAKIADIARARGVDVIVDAAHSFAHIDFAIPDLRADFVAINGHKWLCTPLGVGALYIKKGRWDDIDVDAGSSVGDATRAIHTGTENGANVMSVTTAIDYHEHLGTALKAARLAYVRDYWVDQVADLDRIEIITPSVPGQYGAICAVRTTHLPNAEIPAWLEKHYNMYAISAGGSPQGDALRITPGLFTLTSELDIFVEALHRLNRKSKL